MRRRRWLWFLLLAVPLLLVAADTVYWHVVEQNLASGFANWRAMQRSAGWQVEAGEPTRGGWPLAATLNVPGVAMTGDGGIRWSMVRLQLRVELWRPATLIASAHGTQRLRIGEAPEVAFTAKQMALAMPLQPETPQHVELSIMNLRAGDAGLGSLQVRLDFDPTAGSGKPVADVSARAEAITPAGQLAKPLGPRIANLVVDAALNGPLPPARDLKEQATAWRNGGGSLVIRHLAMHWGPLDLTASGSLTLDDRLQPAGSVSAKAIGYAETLDAFAAHGELSRSAVTAAKAVLSLLASYPADGSTPSVDVPLSLRDSTVSMRQVPLVRLPEVVWP
jgi:hypothetical protein